MNITGHTSASVTLSLHTTPTSVPLGSTTTTVVNGKHIKVVVKEVLKHTAACEACRARKRKCDGQAPCTYCLSKNQECVFAAPRKRGPSINKKRSLNDEDFPETSLVSAKYETDMLDVIEGNNLNHFYGNFIRLILPISNFDIMHPRSTTHKVQSYIALAFIARISGLRPLAQKYICQARVLGGAIYDRPEIDTIAAMMMFAMYMNFTSDFAMSGFYCSLAFALSQMMSLESVGGKLAMFVTNLKLCSDPALAKDTEQLSLAFKRAATELLDVRVMEDLMCKVFLDLIADVLSVLHINILGADQKIMAKRFNAFDDITVSEEGRRRVQQSIKDIAAVSELYAIAEMGIPVKLLFIVEFPLYLMVVELKTGHVPEGVNAAVKLLEAFQYLKSVDALGVVTKVACLFLIGSGCKLLHQAGHTSIALQIFEYIKIICKKMEPEYNHILANTEFPEEGGLATTPIFGPPAYVSNNNYLTPSPPDPNSSKSSSTTFINTCPPNNSPNQSSSVYLLSKSPSPSDFNTSPPIRNSTQSSLPSPSPSPNDTSPLTTIPSNNELSTSSLVLSLLSPTSPTFDTSSSSFEPVPLSLPLSFALNSDITSFENFENSDLENILQQLQSE